MTITLHQRIQAGDSALERSISLADVTDQSSRNVDELSAKMLALMLTIPWAPEAKQSQTPPAAQ